MHKRNKVCSKQGFGENNIFLLCNGGDAAPGYNGTSFLVSFLNIGQSLKILLIVFLEI